MASLANRLPTGAALVAKREDGSLAAPDRPAVGFIQGDGTGRDIWPASKLVLEAAVAKAYQGGRSLAWLELLAGEAAHAQTGEYLPAQTLEDLRELKVAIKGPLATPVGGGMRSLNVTLRRELDLYACIRPVRWLPGVPSPLTRPQDVDMVVFRENTEDVYAGIEYPAGSPQAQRLAEVLSEELGARLPANSAIGVKPMSEANSKRLIRMALDYALARGLPSVTLVHKGNIMKFTEGAFREWGYQLAAEEYAGRVTPQDPPPDGLVVIKDRIADNMFQQVLLRPREFSVIATPNLNGDYLSDALAAQVGGLGMAPGANVGSNCALFEATHGTAPKYAGQDKVNPGSLILSGAMLLEHLGWSEAAGLTAPALSAAVSDGQVTYDLARQIPGANQISCSAFAQAVVDRM